MKDFISLQSGWSPMSPSRLKPANPTGAVLHVRGKLPEAKQAFIRLLDGAGKTAGNPLQARGNFTQDLDLSGYPPGLYNLVISDAAGKVIRTERIIKQ